MKGSCKKVMGTEVHLCGFAGTHSTEEACSLQLYERNAQSETRRVSNERRVAIK